MTSKELALKLTGREIGREITREEEQQAKESGLVVVFGYSDDTMEMVGAINAEAGAYEGGTVYVTKSGMIDQAVVDDCDRCGYFQIARKRAKAITAVWHDEGGPCWTYKTDIPHETFEIMEDGEVFCVGIVFSTQDITNNVDALLELIQENPGLPIVPMVDSEIVADDGYAYWRGAWGHCKIGEYLIGEEKVHFKEEGDFDEIEDALTDGAFNYEQYEAMSDDEAKGAYNSLPWIKAIIVYIDLPES